MTCSRWIPCLLALATAGVAIEATAQVPSLVPVQGVLYNAVGDPVSGSVNVRFALYDAESGGRTLWSEVVRLDVELGLFASYLGGNGTPVDPTIFVENPVVWLGIAVDTDPELERVRLATAPYAAFAGYCEQAAALESTAAARIVSNALEAGDARYSRLGHGHAWSEIAGVPNGLADGDNDLLAGINCNLNQIIRWNGAAWACSDEVGDIASVGAGTGLSGGGAAGDVSLSVDFAATQRRLQQSCAPGSSIRVIDQFGNVECESDDTNPGDITDVIAGTGLAGGGSSGSVSLRLSPGVTPEYVVQGLGEAFSGGLDMTPTSSSLCYLTQVRVPDDNDEDDSSHCRIITSGLVWRLEGYTTADEAGNLICAARCMTW